MTKFFTPSFFKEVAEKLAPLSNDNPRLCGLLGGQFSLYSITPIYKKAKELAEQADKKNGEITISSTDEAFFINSLRGIADAQRDLARNAVSHDFNQKAETSRVDEEYPESRRDFALTLIDNLHQVQVDILQRYKQQTSASNQLTPV